MIRRAVFLILGLFIFPFSSYSQELSPEQEMERMRIEQKRLVEQELEMLREENPELYKKRKRAIERQEKVNKILSSFHKEKMNSDQAERRLRPLIRKEVEESLDSLDLRIERLERELSELKKVRRNPNILIQKKIDRFLGKETPGEEFF